MSDEADDPTASNPSPPASSIRFPQLAAASAAASLRASAWADSESAKALSVRSQSVLAGSEFSKGHELARKALGSTASDTAKKLTDALAGQELERGRVSNTFFANLRAQLPATSVTFPPEVAASLAEARRFSAANYGGAASFNQSAERIRRLAVGSAFPTASATALARAERVALWTSAASRRALQERPGTAAAGMDVVICDPARVDPRRAAFSRTKAMLQQRAPLLLERLQGARIALEADHEDSLSQAHHSFVESLKLTRELLAPLDDVREWVRNHPDRAQYQDEKGRATTYARFAFVVECVPSPLMRKALILDAQALAAALPAAEEGKHGRQPIDKPSLTFLIGKLEAWLDAFTR